jgi:hypothetical protein
MKIALTDALLVAMSAVAAWWFCVNEVRQTHPRLSALNYRDIRLPLVLGPIVAVVALTARFGGAVAAHTVASTRTWSIPAGAVLVFLAGLLDDLTGAGPRGIRGHLQALRRGTVTTGIVKLVAAVAGGATVLAMAPRHGALDSVLAVVVMAAAANLWNGLDVAPGRAGKAFLLAGVLLLPLFTSRAPVFQAAAVGATAGVLRFDLRELAMLGDSGSNLLGFVAGAHFATQAGTLGLAVGAAVLVGLNVLAETITLSRLIEATPPLRWLDRLGRRQAPASGRAEKSTDLRSREG